MKISRFYTLSRRKLTEAAFGTRNSVKLVFIVCLVSIAVPSIAILLAPFKGWADLVQKSPDIVIARSAATSDPQFVLDGSIWSDIEVISVLKGDTKTGPARMVSQHWPKQGDRFLIFSTFESNQVYVAYNATEQYRIVPISRYFPTNQLSGKPLKEQIKIILDARLEDLKKEMQRADEEKKRLEQGLK